MTRINVDHLLESVEHRVPGGRGAPRQVDLRRGISDAYYALFHELTYHVAQQVLRGTSSYVVERYRRTLKHGQLADYAHDERFALSRLHIAGLDAHEAVGLLRSTPQTPGFAAFLSLLALDAARARAG